MSGSSALDPSTVIGVIGAGAMGSGIATVALKAGHRVLLHDTAPAAIERAITSIRQDFDRQVDKQRMSAQERDACSSRIEAASMIEMLAPCGLVIEAIVENLEVKTAVLKRIEAIVETGTIIASNTSSLSITAIAARLSRPESVVGMHFFNPAQILPLVEVIHGKMTAPEVAKTIFDTASAWKKVPVYCTSTPGFIVNRVARPFYGEALRLLSERTADPATLDAILRESGGFRMGPFELMDMIGHDVNYAVTCSVFEAFYQDPRFKPSLLQKDLVDAGWLGRKAGRGFYDYNTDAVRPQATTASPENSPVEVVIEGDLGCARPLVDIARRAGLSVSQTNGSGGIRIDGVLVALTDGRNATERSTQSGETVILFDLALDYESCVRVALAAPDQVNKNELAAATGFFQSLGKAVSFIDDAPGMVVMRTVAMLANEAAEAVHQDVASQSDIDLAMQKGVNYPLGPLAWADRIGTQTVCKVLQHIADFYGEDRYRVSPLLRRKASAAGNFSASL